MPLLETSEPVSLPKQGEHSTVDTLYHALVRISRVILFPLDAPSPLDELPISQVRCLSIVGNEEGKKMQEIATRLHIKLPAMSQMVDRLVRKGLMERRPDPADRRVARLHLTSTAKQMIAEARQMRMDHLRDIAGNLEPSQVDRMVDDLLLLLESSNKLQQEHEGNAEESDPNRSVGTINSHDPVVDMLAHRARGGRS